MTTEYEMPRSLSTSLTKAIESFDRSRWDLRPTTKRGYLKSLQRFARTHATLADLTAENVNDYLASVADHRTMARNDCIAFRQLSKWATQSSIFPTDPLAGVSLPKGRGGRRKPFADAEVREIIHAAADSITGVRDRAIVVVGLSAALRPRELWQLLLSDVALREGWLTVRLETTKSEAGERTIPLDPQAIAVLDAYINDHRGPKAGPLFLNAHGDPFHYYGFMAIFARITKRLEAKGIDFSAYRMRHTGITNWARPGVGLNAPTIQQLAGHKSIVTTQGYIGRLSREDLAGLPSAFSKIYGRAV